MTSNQGVLPIASSPHNHAYVNLSDFTLTPFELKGILDRYVIGQEQAKRTIATTFCNHYRRLRRDQETAESSQERVYANVLLIGPSGCGKTYLAEIAAKHLGVPHLLADSTQLTSSGYVGDDVKDLIHRLLLLKAKSSIPDTEIGMIILDEVDKIRKHELSGDTLDVAGARVQEELLTLIEGRNVELEYKHSEDKSNYTISVSTRNMLFTMAGAFEGLEEIIARRLGKNVIGFGSSSSVADEEAVRMTTVEPEDLVEYGFNPQLVGRFRSIVRLQQLGEKDLYNILCLESCGAINTKKRELAGYKIELEFTDEALREIAHQAHARGMGARGLNQVIEETLREYQFLLPSTSVRNFVVTPEMVLNPQRFLPELNTKVGEDRENWRSVFPFTYTPRRYRSTLQRMGIDPKYIPAAVKYGMDEQVLPHEIPSFIDFLDSEIRSYTPVFNEEFGVKVTFTPALRRALMIEALNRGGEIDAVFKIRVADYIRNTAIMKTIPQGRISVTTRILRDPAGFVSDIYQQVPGPTEVSVEPKKASRR